MKKQSFGKTVLNAMKKTTAISGKALKVGKDQALKLEKAAMAIEIPSSLNWIYSFGFKVGLFLILKSFLILRYQFSNLQLSGYIMVMSQMIQALILIACGVLMQNKALYDEPLHLRKISNCYGYALLLGFIVFVLRETFSWNFFKEAQAVNWFVDALHVVTKGAGEFGLSLLFWDCDLWGMFCSLLYFITAIYLHVNFDYESGFWAKALDRVSFLRNAYPVPQPIEAKNPDDPAT